jgi:hypothetical protein
MMGNLDIEGWMIRWSFGGVTYGLDNEPLCIALQRLMDRLMLEMEDKYWSVLRFHHGFNAFLVYLDIFDGIYQWEHFVVVLMYLEAARLMDLGGYKRTVVNDEDMGRVVKRAMSYRLSRPSFS